MGGQTTTTQNSNQQSQTAPWAAAQPQLQSLLGNLGRLDTGVTPAQSTAAGMITNAAGAIPSFAPQLTNTANALLAGGPNYGGILSGAYNNLQGALSPYLDPARLNPMSTPGFSQALGAMGSNITNQVNDQFAAAGRDLSPGNSQALAYGLATGEAPTIASQYNANVGNQFNAANTLYNAGNTTARGLRPLDRRRTRLLTAITPRKHALAKAGAGDPFLTQIKPRNSTGANHARTLRRQLPFTSLPVRNGAISRDAGRRLPERAHARPTLDPARSPRSFCLRPTRPAWRRRNRPAPWAGSAKASPTVSTITRKR